MISPGMQKTDKPVQGVSCRRWALEDGARNRCLFIQSPFKNNRSIDNPEDGIRSESIDRAARDMSEGGARDRVVNDNWL